MTNPSSVSHQSSYEPLLIVGSSSSSSTNNITSKSSKSTTKNRNSYNNNNNNTSNMDISSRKKEQHSSNNSNANNNTSSNVYYPKWKILCFGQLVSFLYAMGGALASTLEYHCNWSAPTFCTGLLYTTTAIFNLIPMMYERRNSKEDYKYLWFGIIPLYGNPILYMIMGIINLETFYFVNLSFRDTAITSATLLGSLATPAAMIFSKLLLKRKYNFIHLLGVFICMTGVSINVLHDATSTHTHAVIITHQQQQSPLQHHEASILGVLATEIDTTTLDTKIYNKKSYNNNNRNRALQELLLLDQGNTDEDYNDDYDDEDGGVPNNTDDGGDDDDEEEEDNDTNNNDRVSMMIATADDDDDIDDSNINVIDNNSIVIDDIIDIDPYPYRLRGDIYAIIGGILFGLSDVICEITVQNVGSNQEYLAMTGTFASIFAIVQSYTLEKHDIYRLFYIPDHTNNDRNNDFISDDDLTCTQHTAWGLLLLFVIVEYFGYYTCSKFLIISESALLNLSILTENLWSVIFSVFVQGIQPKYTFYISLLFSITGVSIYEIAPSPIEKDYNNNNIDNNNNKFELPTLYGNTSVRKTSSSSSGSNNSNIINKKVISNKNNNNHTTTTTTTTIENKNSSDIETDITEICTDEEDNNNIIISNSSNNNINNDCNNNNNNNINSSSSQLVPRKTKKF